MHDVPDNFDINLTEISKIEGSASLEVKIRNKKIEDLKFSISEWKRFYTQAIQGKPAVAVPQLVARICGTCSNAHLLCSIKTVEKALGIIPSSQTMLLRRLIYNGLIIRDHALHLYIFALPDLYNKNSILDFDENDPLQKQLLEDTFEIKEVGNRLSKIVGGRSVHAPYPTIGGFLAYPHIQELKNLRDTLIAVRPKIFRLIEIFAKSSFSLSLPNIIFNGLSSQDYSFLTGQLVSSQGNILPEERMSEHVEAVVIPYSHARGFTYKGSTMMVGALARINLYKKSLHAKTKADTKMYLDLFPSYNLFHNNLAQALEILHVIDTSSEIIDGISTITSEEKIPVHPKQSVGVGVIEAPRGTLYHKYEIDDNGIVQKGEIIVPTGQNQVLMEKSIHILLESLLKKDTPKEQIILEVEKLIRAFDPCMSCASHFLKVKWS
ncbi:hypothetical protein A3F60_03360 [Candidatus Roizmanbacteria bacterium RIFCSPHIGHO2_12_FULL_39_8]|uniref:Hydrogenase/sulfur reductase subunit alpha n=1 Tax=Candidatus Roizmanbacteria bacterium RIFCSPHIGHO2_12_FULL_39_8 TaxID=1802050 RepID=A0A1F7I3Y3_9BACT|nr:MAG: hypothetical protein A3F60_03360 [Candidatus Roizmanbacteria bacterium RIFCSPHIGHO2_12_FULL_39_8]